jgi:signal transduction histidine kinase
VRRQILGVAALAAVLSTLLFGLPLAVAVRHLYFNEEQSELERLADRAAVQVATRPPAARGRLLPQPESGTELGLYDRAGTRIAGNGPARADTATRAAQRGGIGTDGGGRYLVVAVPVNGGGAAGQDLVVRAASRRLTIEARAFVTWLGMAVLAGLAVVVAVGVAHRQSRRLATPLERLARAAHRLGDGDFTVRTDRSGIGEIDQVGAALDSTAERLDNVLARERAFAAGASHQLRTPLTGMRLGLERALEEAGTDREAALRAALDEADRLEAIISDLTRLRRDDPADLRAVDLDELFAELRSGWGTTLAAAGRPLDLAAEADLPVAQMSASALRQVMRVLLDNATQHGEGPVTVAARDAGGVLALDVADRGPGLPEDAAEVFTTARREGHGIGLGLARTLAEASGGRLVAAHRPGGGATFTLLVPNG